MSARNLHRIMGAVFHHAHPECPLCAHFRPSSGPVAVDGWIGDCDWKHKRLCCIRRRLCEEYKPAPASPSEHGAPKEES